MVLKIFWDRLGLFRDPACFTCFSSEEMKSAFTLASSFFVNPYSSPCLSAFSSCSRQCFHLSGSQVALMADKEIWCKNNPEKTEPSEKSTVCFFTIRKSLFFSIESAIWFNVLFFKVSRV